MASNYSAYSLFIKIPQEEALKWLEEQGHEAGIDTRRSKEVSGLFLSVEDSADLERAAEILQDYLKRFDPKGCVSFTWSEWCDRPRVGEFGGGCVVVTAENYIIEPTSERLVELTEKALDKIYAPYGNGIGIEV